MILKKISYSDRKLIFRMQTIVNSFNKLLPVGKKVKKYLPFFIGFKLLIALLALDIGVSLSKVFIFT